jgi:vacuolar-type H+-ATPase subunit I/STV1
MQKGVLFFIFLISVCLLSGCAALRYFDGSSDEQIRGFNMSKGELREEVESLQSDNKILLDVLDRKQARLDEYEEKDKANIQAISEGQALIESLEKEKNTLLEENERLKSAALVKEETPVEKQVDKPAPTAAVKKLRIKVLAGSGELSAARKLSKKLTQLGYKVERMDVAPKAKFKSDTVFFARDRQKEARELAGRLGGGTVIKPLTWSSIFDVIIVAK